MKSSDSPFGSGQGVRGACAIAQFIRYEFPILARNLIHSTWKTVFLSLVLFAAIFAGGVASAEVTTALQFVPVTPCRIMDTRGPNGTFGGPVIGGSTTRSVPVQQSACNIPVTARAYALNVTVVPSGSLGYLSIWPTGLAQPVVSTLNSFDGRIVANAAIVPAGENGSISVFVSNPSHVVIDVNGYFVPASTQSSLAFYPVAPCRVADTRGNGFTGAFGAPSMTSAAIRNFPVRSSACGIPATARAYSLNVTVVPSGPLGYLTLWPTGQGQPLVSTLNSPQGDIVANAAIVPSGTSGSVSVAVTSATNVILDINGYFAPAGGAGAEALYTVPPCRVADTRGNGLTGAFGVPGMDGNSTRAFPIPSGNCNVPATAQAYSLNVTVVPPATLAFLTAWPAGVLRPNVSTLNSTLGKVTANAALVPAGQNGAVNIFVTHPTHVILDINGFFGPVGGALPPAILSSPVTTATVGTPYTYSVLATNPNPPDLVTFSLPVAPAGMTIQSTTGLIQWTPTGQQSGAQQVQVRARDSHNRTGLQTFSVSVTGGPQTGGTTFVPGNNTVVLTQTIGPSGGTMTVGGSGTAIDGAKIVFPVGALPANSSVKISFNRGTVNPVSGTFSGAALALDVTGPSTFSQPVTLTLPYTGGSNTVPVPYFADADGKLRPGQIISIDRQAHTFTFQTFHASLFTWLFGTMSPPNTVVSTAFLPANDGFQVVNTGSTYNREGECFGMTAFSLWYLHNQKAALGKFYPKFMDVVGTDSANRSIRGQNVIATRAFTSITQKWTSYLPEVRRQQTLSPAERYASIDNIVANTGEPVLIYLYHADTTISGAHSVLAYELDNATHRIAIYDPNLPGTVQHIQYSTATNAFAPYCNSNCYDGIIYNGDGSLSVTEPYTNILADAQRNFTNSGGATIDVNSHTNGQVLTTRLPTLSGVVHSSQLLVTKLTVIIGSAEYSTNIPVNGTYSIPVALSDGVNHLKFKTEGTNAKGELVTTSNNYDTKDFTLKAVVSSSVVLMTLTWDKNDTDVDTYVIDPTGDFSAYYHKVTADGGDLDQDITRGFGPEHWTLLNTDTVRYGQPYKFRVHYYSDHNNGPTNYTVTIELYNGTSRQTTLTYSGGLSVSNPLNDGPNGTGPDWAEIATIVLTQASGDTAPPFSQTLEDGHLVITVPVPPAEIRRKLKP